MILIPQSPKKALKAFLKQKPLRSEIDLFKTNLIDLLDKISVIEKGVTDESEEHLKNNLRDFLRDTFYRDTNTINTKDKKDLVIHLGKTTDSEVGVIIEAKRPTNIAEMVTAENPNKKAFHEIILYYMNERLKAGNNQLKQLIITNVYEWYIIDANHFDKYIYRNTQIKKLYDTKINDQKDNPFFYEEIAKIVSNLDIEIPCVYFDIREYNTILRNNKKEDDRELSALLKILSPQHLLKIVTPNDSNSLNEKFYKELLHIIGLEEAKEGGKNIIRRKIEKRDAASLVEATIEALNTEDVLHRLPDQSIYGSTKDERIFNISLELGITWINRILFLKLLEGQLITYHQGNKDYRFLNSETINDFDELFKLFHRVLAVNINERSAALKDKYIRVPYLNSSLFEISELEDLTIKINSLDDGGKLELINTTILKDVKKKTANLPTLNYLFQFLDAYDFASEGTEDIQEENKTIINASVLGKVFEKINGYKDGSIFTPAFITMYMCKQSIRLAVVEKFNEALSDKDKPMFDKFEDIKNYTSRIFKTQEVLKANEIINSLRICDPAVGSGHFLVSSLNEIISIKSELGILAR
jgi:adenine-specific DNA-methyltransferase